MICLTIAVRGVYTTEQKWHGSDKNWNGSNSFCKETVKFYPFCNWSIGACGPDTERIKLHCFFAKTIGTVPVFVGSVPFLLCRVNAPVGIQRVQVFSQCAVNNFVLILKDKNAFDPSSSSHSRCQKKVTHMSCRFGSIFIFHR